MDTIPIDIVSTIKLRGHYLAPTKTLYPHRQPAERRPRPDAYEETAVAVLETAEAEAVKVLAKASTKAVNVLAMAETMISFARGQLKASIENAAYMLKASEELSASELLLVEDFDADNLSTTQKELLGYMTDNHELLHYMQGGYSMGSGADGTKKDNFEQCAKALRESRKVKAAALKQHQADAATNLLREDATSKLLNGLCIGVA